MTRAIPVAGVSGWIVVLALVTGRAGTSAMAQDAGPASTGPPVEETEPPAPPSLDELLGIEEDRSEEGAEDAARRESDEELQRRLDEVSIVDAFELAIEKMSLSADLLDERFDPGLGTQRVQEDILARLEHLIEQARKMGSTSSAASSGNPSQPQSEPSTPPRRQSGKPPGGKRNPQASDSEEGEPPPREDGDIRTVLEESQSEWGHLPERVREMLLQGRKEKFSSLYDRLTREYYRRLAEEGSP